MLNECTRYILSPQGFNFGPVLAGQLLVSVHPQQIDPIDSSYDIGDSSTLSDSGFDCTIDNDSSIAHTRVECLIPDIFLATDPWIVPAQIGIRMSLVDSTGQEVVDAFDFRELDLWMTPHSPALVGHECRDSNGATATCSLGSVLVLSGGHFGPSSDSEWGSMLSATIDEVSLGLSGLCATRHATRSGTRSGS